MRIVSDFRDANAILGLLKLYDVARTLVVVSIP